jgi:hypothetical protein
VGGLYELVLGNPNTGNQFVFSVFCNGVQIGSTFDDSANVSQVGSSNLFGGLGMFTSLGIPGSLTSFGIMDNGPPPTQIGSVFRQFRTITTAVPLTSGTNLLPDTFFDTNQWLTPDLTSAPATNNQLTVSVEGTYMVIVCLDITELQDNFGSVLYHNGVAVQRGSVTPVTSTSSELVLVGPWSSTFMVYCQPGDTLQPGYFNSGTTVNSAGESTGSFCYWQVGLINCGTLS